MTTLYMYHPSTRQFLGSRPAQIVGGKEILRSAHAVTQHPPDIPAGHAARWTGAAWEIVEDHRQTPDATGLPQGGTPYWLPEEGDTWQSPPRYMAELGPSPAGSVTTRPEKPSATLLEEARAAKTADIQSGYDAALAASLTMPTSAPTAQDVSIGAALFAVDDAEGLAFVRQTHAARRDELLAAVAAAESVEAVRAIEVSYAV